MFSVVVLQWITSEKTRWRGAPLHMHYVLQKTPSRARESGENGNGQITILPEGQRAMQQPYPSGVDSVGEIRECDGGPMTHDMGDLPRTLSAEDDISNCENKSNKREEADRKRQPAVQEIDV